MSEKRKKQLRKIAASKGWSKSMTPLQIQKKLLQQQAEQQEKSAQIGKKRAAKETVKRAKTAVSKFRPRKVDRGNLVFISSGGKRNPHHKGKNKTGSKTYDRKGYLVYVTKTGKKQLIKQHRYGFKATSFSNLQPPLAPKYSKTRQKIYESRAGKTQSGRTVILQRGSIVPTSKKQSFADNVVEKFAKAVQGQLNKTRGQKRFNIKIMVKLTGIDQPVVALIPIDKPDSISVHKGGIINFVKKKMWAHISSDLAAAGYVTAGSANHIRSRKWNKGLTREEWTVDGHNPWDRSEHEVVEVDVFEWIFEKNKYSKGR